MRRRLRFMAPAAVASLLATCIAAAATPKQQKSTVLDVPTPSGLAPLLVQTPDEPSSPAEPGAGPIGPQSQRTLFNRVIVRSDDPAIGAVIGAKGLKATPFEGLDGFWIVATPTVRAAVSAAAGLLADPRVSEAYLDAAGPLTTRSIPTDPGLPNQWSLINTLPESDPLFDVNADTAWNDGYTGAGVVVGLVDEGWDLSHPDLAPNYNADASLDDFGFSQHGTAVAGIVGAAADDGIGGVGVAFDAQISRLYFCCGSTVVADAMLHRNDLNDIKSNSWGPFDTGNVYIMPSIERTAIETAATTGRGGKGEVLVWAGGNGRSVGDRVDYDPYASSRYTIAVGSIDSSDRVSLYSEPGSALMVVAQSDHDLFSSSDEGIYTTASPATYTATFGGTSASAPLAAGVVALMLEANPCLTWRDVQHVLIDSARRPDPTNPGWITNGAGRWINYDYGFGAVDAGAATALAASWTNVGPEITVASPVSSVNTPLPDDAPTPLTDSITVTDDIAIESVEVTINIQHPFIGDLEISLVSPEGTESILALARNDFGTDYTNQVFTSLRCWGEHSAGTWTLRVRDAVPGSTGTWTDWRLTVHGAASDSSCRCDVAEPGGVVDVYDLLAYLSDWFAASPDADLNCSSTVDVHDLLDYLTCWFAGCP